MDKDHANKLDNVLNTYYKMMKKYNKGRKMKCVNCKRKGGTIFTSDKGVLTASCGSLNKKCELNIVIDRGKIVDKHKAGEKLDNDIRRLKDNIMKAKLDILFGYKDQNSVLSEHALNIQSLKELTDKLSEMNNYNLEASTNKDTYIINQHEQEVKNIIEEMKENTSNYRTNGQEQLLSETANLFVEQLQPKKNKIMKLKYPQMSIQIDDVEKVLVKDEHNLLRHQVERTPKILSNKK